MLRRTFLKSVGCFTLAPSLIKKAKGSDDLTEEKLTSEEIIFAKGIVDKCLESVYEDAFPK